MAHECDNCGEWCYCDGEDTPVPEPDCLHVCPEDYDDDEPESIPTEENR